MRVLASHVLALATHAMPARRQAWSDAWRAEFAFIESSHNALDFACGAVVASIKQRFDLQPLSEASRLLTATVFAALALQHICCALDGARILLGGEDPFYLHLIHTSADAARQWREATPFMTALWLLVAGANLNAAQLGLRNQRHSFLIALALAAMGALTMAIVVLWVVGFTPGHRTFLAVIALQTLGALALWRFGMRRFQLEISP